MIFLLLSNSRSGGFHFNFIILVVLIDPHIKSPSYDSSACSSPMKLKCELLIFRYDILILLKYPKYFGVFQKINMK